MSFNAYRKILSLNNYVKDNNITGTYFHGTVKVHGFHGDVIQEKNGSYTIQSKHNIIVDTHNNYHLFEFVNDNLQYFTLLFDDIKKKHNSKNTIKIMISGEWCGHGIKNYVAVCNLKPMFIIFDIIIDNMHYCDMTNYFSIHDNLHQIYNIQQFTTYTIYIHNIHNITKEEKKMIKMYVKEVEKQCPVAGYFDMTGPGEGIVWKSKKLIFKSKGKYFYKCIKNKSNLYKNHLLPIKRLENGIEYMNNMKYDTSLINYTFFIEYIMRDIKEEEEDFLLIDNKIYQSINKDAYKFYTTILLSFIDNN